MEKECLFCANLLEGCDFNFYSLGSYSKEFHKTLSTGFSNNVGAADTLGTFGLNTLSLWRPRENVTVWIWNITHRFMLWIVDTIWEGCGNFRSVTHIEGLGNWGGPLGVNHSWPLSFPSQIPSQSWRDQLFSTASSHHPEALPKLTSYRVGVLMNGSSAHIKGPMELLSLTFHVHTQQDHRPSADTCALILDFPAFWNVKRIRKSSRSFSAT